jgi:methylase of polypeptide subunit release factors
VTDEERLYAVGERLRALGYSFVTVTPATHERVLARGGRGETLRDVFGWSRPFAAGALPADLFELLGPFAVRAGELWKSAVRYSSLQGRLFAHSAFPTVESDAVFFGPDTYRFASLLEARIQTAGNVADVGCGSGAGGILLASRAKSVQLLDINPRALQFASANAALNGARVRTAMSDVLSGADGPLDLVVANPPYLADDLGRSYRDGGGALGTALSVRICEEALDRLQSGGRLLLYTATPVIDGRHLLWPAIEPLLRNTRFDYRELDPDVFGEELLRPAYAHVERIAVVALEAFKL